MGHLGEGTQITTVQDKEIVLTASNGQHFKMKITDLAEAVRQVMQVVTSENNGLMSRDGFYFRGTFDYSNAEVVNNLTKSGMYFHGGSIAGSASLHGILIVFNALPYIAQVDIGGNGVLSYRFNSGSGSTWSAWKSISFT